MAVYSIEGLKERLVAHQKAIDDIIRIIPSKHYLPRKDEDPENFRFAHNKRKNAPKQAVKEASKKAKRAKLNPESEGHKSVLELQFEQKNSEVATAPSPPLAATPAMNALQADSHAKPKNIAELQQRLQERIQELRRKRKASDKTIPSEVSRSEILKRRQERKRSRKEKLNSRNKAPATPMSNATKSENKTILTAPSLPASNMDVVEDLQYGKFQNIQAAQRPDGLISTPKAKKRKSMDTLGQLRVAEKQKQRLQKIKAVDVEKANSIEDSLSWSKAIKLAEGEKVKDDPVLLKKSLKREQSSKKKSAKEWEERKDAATKRMQDAQKKRTENIQRKVEERKERKIKVKMECDIFKNLSISFLSVFLGSKR